MRRVTWTDEKLGERFDAIDRRFDGVDKRLDNLDARLIGVETGLARIWMAIVTGLFGVIAAILVKG